MRKLALIWIVVAALAFSGSAVAQTTAPEATVPPVPTQPEVEEPTDAPAEVPTEETEVPDADPVLPGTTEDDGDDDDDGLSSNTILLLIIGAVVLGLIIFGIAMSQRRPGDPDSRI